MIRRRGEGGGYCPSDPKDGVPVPHVQRMRFLLFPISKRWGYCYSPFQKDEVIDVTPTAPDQYPSSSAS
eukprot:8891740-Pyramimonas_sp.AAC.1